MTEAAQLVEDGLVVVDFPLGPLTTYKTGGPARFYSRPETREQLLRLSTFVAGSAVPVLVVGRGSNLLVSDRGFDGLVIHIAESFSYLKTSGLRVEAGAGTPLPRLARGSVEAGVAGLEFFVGIPGSVGGAVRQNAGCFGVETRDRLEVAVILDLHNASEATMGPDDLEMSYRHSNVGPGHLVVSAVFRGTSDDVTKSGDELKKITRWRKENQPGGTLNAGSVFKNPEGASAGYLIDQAGLKGFSVGEVSVSEKHANFFVAGKGASSRDVRTLIVEVQRMVAEQTGVGLELEIQLVGFDHDD